MDDSLAITVGKAEALVLFDLLWGFRDQAHLSIRNDAERARLWILQASLEKALAEPFSEDYDHLLEEARRTVVANWGSTSGTPQV